MRTLCVGAGLALTAGLLAGAAMKPDVGAFDRPEAPQINTQAPDVDPIGPFDDRLAHAGYAGELPDYVLGTDWKKLVAAPLADPAPELEADPPVESYHQPALTEPQAEVGTIAPAAYREPAQARVSFPSLDGGAAYEDVSRAETPVAPPADVSDEAPPTATSGATPAY